MPAYSNTGGRSANKELGLGRLHRAAKAPATAPPPLHRRVFMTYSYRACNQYWYLADVSTTAPSGYWSGYSWPLWWWQS